MHTLLLGALAAYGTLAGGLFLGQRRLLYRPDRRHPDLGDLAFLGVREVTLTTKDGLGLLAWYLPSASKRPVVAYFHGNGGHIGYRVERLRHFAGEGYGVLFAEYRGYAGNPGVPCEAGLLADGETALDFLAREGIDAGRLVLWGESLGSGVAVHLAAHRRVGALVLEAPFTSVAAAAQLHYPFIPAKLMVRDKFDSVSCIGRVTAPLLVLHGERDRVVPVRMGKALLAAATAPKEGWFAPEADHENLALFGALPAAIAFVNHYLLREEANKPLSSCRSRPAGLHRFVTNS